MRFLTQCVIYDRMLPHVFSLLLILSAAHADIKAGLFTIDSSCAQPESYVRAANAVTARMSSCLSRINPEVGEEVTEFRARHTQIRIVCAPREAGKSTECAHAVHGYPEIVLTRTKACGSLENTIFHEFLHVATSLDDMTAPHHNDSSCRRFDAIYACSEVCFPSMPTLKKAGIGWFGCKTCVTDEAAADRICSTLPIDIDTAFQTCKPKGYN